MQTQAQRNSNPTPYELLDVPESAKPEEITNTLLGKALLKWGAKYTRQINEAFSKLRDPDKRLQIDFFIYRKERTTRLRVNPVAEQDVTSSKEPTLNVSELPQFDDIFRRH